MQHFPTLGIEPAAADLFGCISYCRYSLSPGHVAVLVVVTLLSTMCVDPGMTWTSLLWKRANRSGEKDPVRILKTKGLKTNLWILTFLKTTESDR